MDNGKKRLVQIVHQINVLVLLEILLDGPFRIVNVDVRAQWVVRNRLPGDLSERVPGANCGKGLSFVPL